MHKEQETTKISRNTTLKEVIKDLPEDVVLDFTDNNSRQNFNGVKVKELKTNPLLSKYLDFVAVKDQRKHLGYVLFAFEESDNSERTS